MFLYLGASCQAISDALLRFVQLAAHFGVPYMLLEKILAWPEAERTGTRQGDAMGIRSAPSEASSATSPPTVEGVRRARRGGSVLLRTVPAGPLRSLSSSPPLRLFRNFVLRDRLLRLQLRFGGPRGRRRRVRGSAR